MILFLDFDGVLHPDPTTEEQTFRSRDLLWKILRECPHAEVVFSTSWRNNRSMECLTELVTAGGGEDLIYRFIGMNPLVPPADPREDYRRREIECLAWLQENGHRWLSNQPPHWLALDDMAYWFKFPCSNLYCVNHITGLTSDDVPKIIEQLRRLSLE